MAKEKTVYKGFDLVAELEIKRLARNVTISFRQLSWPIKVAVIASWVIGIIYLITLLTILFG